MKPSNQTTKVRVVYDASARCSGSSPSLNDCLLQGPSLLPDLCGILLRFRLSPVAVCSDIEKAFLQLGLNVADRDVTRFLWLRDITQPATTDNVITFRFCRVPFGIVSSPFLLAATIRYHFRSDASETGQQILRNTYVDNVITGKDSIDDAVSYYHHAKNAFAAASMNLREWTSNSLTVLEQLPVVDRAKGYVHKCLGLSWNTQDDTLKSPSVYAADHIVYSKRQILQVISQVFDPLGLLSPVVIRAKILMQEAWKCEVEWDCRLPETILGSWRRIAQDLDSACETSYPRYLGIAPGQADFSELHVFCDASQSAYATVAYLRLLSGDSVSTQIIFSKSRVAPVKSVSIPRLELMAAVLGVKVIRFLRQQLLISLPETYLWTDSTTVLHWLESKKSLPVFIKNRITFIQSVPGITHHYVQSHSNPADLPSRGVGASALRQSDLWWHGPSWLHDSSSFTAQLGGEGLLRESQDLSLHSDELDVPDSPLLVNSLPVHDDIKEPPFAIDIEKFSSLSSLLRVSAYCLRFVSRLRHRPALTGSLHVTEFKEALKVWLLYVQETSYRAVRQALADKRRHNLITQLDLFIGEDGLVRCKGRLKNAELCYNAMYPVLLPRKHRFTRLVVEDCHRKVMHSGVAHTLSRVRYQYWIPCGRSIVKSVLHKCQTCRKHDGGPYAMPAMAPLPATRVTLSRPFSHVGIDYFGPVFIKHQSESTKSWVCLVTCTVTRAVHLELVADMTAVEFLLAFRRFVARCGSPLTVITDIAPQFKLAKSVLDLAWEQITSSESVLSYAATCAIKWSFIVELSPWMGGFYERLVGIVKRCLRKCLGRSRLTFNQFYTVLAEVEAVVNSRPLVYVDNDVKDILTPSHFLGVYSSGLIPFPADDDYIPPSSRNSLLEVWKKGQRRLEQFWKMWRDEYLLSLREAHRASFRQQRSLASEGPSVGDVVLIKEELPRGSWRLGRVTETFTSADDAIRSASVITADHTVLKRPLSRLYPIECGLDSHGISSDSLPSPDAVIGDTQIHENSRPVRAAAVESRKRSKLMIEHENSDSE